MGKKKTVVAETVQPVAEEIKNNNIDINPLEGGVVRLTPPTGVSEKKEEKMINVIFPPQPPEEIKLAPPKKDEPIDIHQLILEAEKSAGLENVDENTIDLKEDTDKCISGFLTCEDYEKVKEALRTLCKIFQLEVR